MTVTPWIYNKQPLTEIPEGYRGFVYLITNNTDGRKYIGKKSFYSRKTIQKNKKRKKVDAESDWKDYYGSNKKLQEDVERLGKGAFHREIIKLCTTKGELSYYEIKEQLIRDAILNENYYNEWITCKISRSHLPK